MYLILIGFHDRLPFLLIDVPLVLTLLTGILPMAYVGTKVAVRSKAERLEKLYGVMVLLYAVFLFVTKLFEPAG